MPGTVTVGFCRVLVKPPGPVQLYMAPATDEFTFNEMDGIQTSDPPVAIISGAVLFSGTVIEAVVVQPPEMVPVTMYKPPLLMTGFCSDEVNPLGPVHA